MAAPSTEPIHSAEILEREVDNVPLLQTVASRTKVPYCIKLRYVQVTLMFFGLICAHSIRSSMSIAIVAMVNHKDNDSKISWTPKEQGLLLSAFYWVYAFNQLPGGFLTYKFGGRILMGCSIISAGFISIIIPPMTKIGGFTAIFLLRMMQGFFEGIIYPAMTHFCSNWTPRQERSTIVTVSFAGSLTGNVLSMIFSGIIAKNYSWEKIFYAYGLLSLGWGFCWFLLSSETPETHKLISEKEKDYIVNNREMDSKIRKGFREVPWKEIMCSKPVWANALITFAELYGYCTLQTELPTYISASISDMNTIGLLAALPHLVMTITSVLSSYVCDLLKEKQLLTATVIRKLSICVGFMGQSCCLMLAVKFETFSTSMACIILATGAGGIAFCSMNSNILELSPEYSSFIMVISNTLGNLSGIIAPNVNGAFLSMSSQCWFWVFFTAAMMYINAGIFFLIFGSGEIQSWSKY